MDKTAIRNFAIEARKILMKSAITEAGFYGITKDGCAAPVQKGSDFEVYQTLAGTENRIYGDDIKRRANLVKAIQEQGFEQVIEETAYTWFNRIIAIRFMEVNNYLPTRVRVLSSETGSGTPDIITQADTIELNLTANELDRIQTAKRENKYDEAFRLLFVKQCNELNEILPGLFEKTNDYMELLLKITYTGDGVVRMLVDSIPEDNFNVETEGQVEIIGWMYQYYNTELKDDTFAKLKKNVKITKERIPAATQLFTPDWIVRYMVENALGRVWIEHLRAVDPSIDEKVKAEEFGWKYYLSEAEQEDDVASQLVEIRKNYRELTPQDITCIDPCMGSGHILVYMFDVLMDIYRSEGFSEREAVFDILEKNIRGLDIDRRAYQLSYFALMMKARGYNRIFFRGRENIDGERVQAVPQVYAIEESNSVNRDQLQYLGENLSELEKNNANNQLIGLLDQLKDAKEYGSLLKIESYDWNLLKKYVSNYSIPGQMDFGMIGIETTHRKLNYIVALGKVMADKYDVVTTNPPYMGCRKGMNPILKKFVEKLYPCSKSDLYACFIEKCFSIIKGYGFSSLITQQSFMFTDDYKELRGLLIDNVTFVNMAHLGADAFPEINGEVVQTTTYTTRKLGVLNKKYKGTFSRLLDYACDDKLVEFNNENNIYFCRTEDFCNVKATPFSYWLSDKMRKSFDIGTTFEECGNPRAGITTGDNDSFLRLWFEVAYKNIEFESDSVEDFHSTGKMYVPYNKGGEKVKWFGNRDYVIKFDEKNYNILANQGNHLPSRQYYMLPCITWSDISGRSFAARYCPKGSVFDVKGSCGFPSESNFWLSLAFLNSALTPLYIDSLNPTTTTQVGDLKRIPIMEIDKEKLIEINSLAQECVQICREDWNLDESSWEFKKHYLVGEYRKIEDAYRTHARECELRYERLIEIEKRINTIFIDAYGLNDEVDNAVNLNEIKIRKANEHDAVISLISYAVGCMMGRFSLTKEGIVSAGEELKNNDYGAFLPDADGIIPITDEPYFKDDIVNLFIEWIRVVYGEESLNDNLEYVSKCLGGKSLSAKDNIRKYFLTDFYKDHCSIYSIRGSGNRPIYWLFSTGDNHGFKCLMYVHRYDRDKVGKIRSDYLVQAQTAIENALKNTEYAIQAAGSAVDKAQATKNRDKYIKQLNEIKLYYGAISHLALQRIEINLDDGIGYNYSKFQKIEVVTDGAKNQVIDLLAKI